MKKISGNSLKRLMFKKGPVMVVFMMLLFFCFMGVAMASSEQGGESKGWVATDTYKVMNFSVLAIGLFFLLRKPTSQALNSRIKGIKDQLDELETKKKAAEKQLAEYNEKFSQLEQETQKLIEDYIRQGNEAKARIIDEAKKAAEKLEEQARRNIDHEFKQAKLELQQEILEKALEKSEEILTNKITAKDQEKLVDEYLEKVVA
ncbi:MAG: ATP synthase F0 subunit B [Deltaproteobacteria bacterium]|jgi:F-type H+-transporting ATPase subunit b|nr:ATP synthase F0 subunit B [Deltaproteobacteria bacterium]MBW1748646.1 ATP synthase F0 subunit B [Deltaproteobacteria bacterium]MBW1827421.1 ATP synthase F0 subunit B [Deltaproteobacteria bacterium]MBW1968543.1 ATP synthase F0 subunit B [Deltaproteobacteria bacterium]MBW2156313.1 ATP synthase F0 subunit B [Deltaproteobacteria bacterium]